MSQETLHRLGLEDSDRIASSLGGGFPRGSLVVLEGNDGAGKSVWSQRFARGFAEEDYTVTYVSPENRAVQFIEQMDSLGYDIIDPLLDGRLMYFWADLDGLGSERNLTKPFLQDDDMWQKSDIVIIDNLDLLLINDTEYQNAVRRGDADEAIQRLYRALGERTTDGTTVILTVDPERIPADALRPLRQVSDVYLVLEARVGMSAIKRSMAVRRFTTMQEYVDDKIAYSVQPNVGLIIETQTVT